MPLDNLDSIEAYLAAFGSELAERVRRENPPLVDPAVDPVHPRIAGLLRTPYAAQAYVITALGRAFEQESGAVLVGEQGSGKTIIALGLMHVMFPGPFRALVMAPGISVRKLRREAERTIPGVRVVYLRSYKQCVAFERFAPAAPTGPEIYILARDRAKLGYRRRGAYLTSERHLGVALCPSCGARQETPRSTPTGITLVPVPLTELDHGRSRCVRCKTPLWTVDREAPRRVAPADYIGRRLKGTFDLFVADEAHELKAADSLQGQALGRLARAAKRTLLLTGTLTAGHSTNVQHLLGRIAMDRLVAEGMGYRDRLRWVSAYGVSERVETTMPNGQTRRSRHERPGVSPRIFSRYLLPITAFLNLSDLAAYLPPYEERVELIDMDPELETAYAEFRDSIRLGMTSERRIYRGRLGAFVDTLLTYIDHPSGWAPLHHPTRPQQILATPTNLSLDVEYAKDRALIAWVQAEAAERRGVVVYVSNTGAHDVSARVTRILRGAGISVREMRADVPTEDREAWIEKADTDGVQAIVANAKLISVSLDFVRPTLIWYQLPGSLYTFRQASRRAWRLTQTQPCRTIVLCYRSSIQSRLAQIYAQRLSAALTVEGRLSEEGLRALAGEDDITTQLARSLVDGVPEVANVENLWRDLATRETAALGHARATAMELVVAEAVALRMTLGAPAIDNSSDGRAAPTHVGESEELVAVRAEAGATEVPDGPIAAPRSRRRSPAAPRAQQMGFLFAASA